MRRRRRSKKGRVPVGQEGVEDITRRLSTSKIEEETGECWCDVFTEEILPRLPAKNLEILKTVCKNWLQTISSPYFVRLHLNKAYSQSQSQIRVLMIPWPRNLVMKFMIESKYNINCDDDVETKQIPFPRTIHFRLLQILGSCDGLLCLSLVCPIQIVVYNPSTDKYLWVQHPVGDNYTIQNYTPQSCWFGHHPSSGEYVLVLWDLDWKLGVYKFISGPALEQIHSTPYFIPPQFPAKVKLTFFERRATLLHGALHWPAVWINNQDFRHVICTYHLENNNYSEISPPSPVSVCREFKLGVNAEGCLFVIFFSGNAELEMWVMKEYGVERSWAKQANIVGPCHLYRLVYFPNGDLILDVGSFELFKYSFNDNKVVRLITDHDHSRCEAIVCVDSLVSPTIVLSNSNLN